MIFNKYRMVYFVLFSHNSCNNIFPKIFVFINNNVQKVLVAESLFKFSVIFYDFPKLEFYRKLFYEFFHIKILFKK